MDFFQWISIMTEPIKGIKNSVSVRFRNSKTQKWVDIETNDYVINYDSMKATFNDTRIGQLSFQGKIIHLNSKNKENDSDNLDFLSTFTYRGQTLPIKFRKIDGD